MAQSWFERVFGSSVEESAFTVEERKLIRDFYFEQARKAGDRENRKYREERDHDDDDRGKKGKKGKKKDKKHGKDKELPPGLAAPAGPGTPCCVPRPWLGTSPCPPA